MGRTYCPHCGNRVQRDTVDLVADRFLQQTAGSRWYLLCPVKIAGKADSQKLRDRLFDLRKRGFTRLFQEGVTFYDAKDYEKARAAFLQAYALKKHPSVLLNLAQSELRSGHEADAAQHFDQYLRENLSDPPARCG